MAVFFRADASARMGTGHVMRCLAMAEELRKRGVPVLFICRPHAGDMIGLLERYGYPVHALSAPAYGGRPFPAGRGEPPLAEWLGVPWNEDAEEVLAFLESRRRQGTPPDWMVVDHYALDARWETRVRSEVPGIFALDDLADRSHDCDVLLDASEEEASLGRYRGLIPAGCKRLFGPAHSLLRAEFAALRRSVGPRSGAISRILVSFGGSDPDDFTSKAMEALDNASARVDVVVGAAHPRKTEIESRCRARSGWTFHCQTGEMARLIAEADFFLGAGGNSAWERCCLGLPGIAVSLAENQSTILKILDAEGAACNLGRASEIGVPAIREALRRFASSPGQVAGMSEKAFALTDGLGASRAVDVIMRGGA